MPHKDPEKRKAYKRQWYRAGGYVEGRKQVKARKAEIVSWFNELRSKLSCKFCPERHPACIEFHHVDGKDIEVSRAVAKGWGRERILKEIEKCEPLCANCHRKLHWYEKVRGASV